MQGSVYFGETPQSDSKHELATELLPTKIEVEQRERERKRERERERERERGIFLNEGVSVNS